MSHRCSDDRASAALRRWSISNGTGRRRSTAPTVERVFSLDFLAQRENGIIVAPNGLGKTMLAKNLAHQAILAGHSARLITAADLILDLTSQETARALQRRLRTYLRPSLIAIDEIGYLAYDAHAADLLFQVVSRRYEQKSLVVTTKVALNEVSPVRDRRVHAGPYSRGRDCTDLRLRQRLVADTGVI